MSNCPPYHQVLLHDVARQLALAHQAKLSLGQRTKLDCRSMILLAQHSRLCGSGARHMAGGLQGPGPAFVLTLLQHAGLVSPAHGRLCLTETGRLWLTQPAQAQLGRLREVWWGSPQMGNDCLAVTRARQPSPRYWQQVVVSLGTWITTLSCQCWTPCSEVHAFLAREGIPPMRSPGANLPRVRQAMARQTSQMVSLVLDCALPCLGLVHTRRNAQGVRLRPTREGAAWLGAAISRQREVKQSEGQTALELAPPGAERLFPIAPQAEVSVDDNLRVTVAPAAPASLTFDLAHCARLLTGRGSAARYQITRKSIEQGQRWGYSVPALSFLLARVTDGRLPLKAIEQLMQWQEELGLFWFEPGYRMRPVGVAVLGALRQRKAFSQRCQFLVSGQEVWVAQREFGPLARYLRRLGYTVQREGAPSPAPHGQIRTQLPQLWPSLQQILPMPQLVVALRTYQTLRARVPGLAELGLTGLLDALAAALGPAEASAAERLVASHIALVEQSLTRADVGANWNDRGAPGRANPEQISASEGQAGGATSLAARLEGAVAQGTSVMLTYVDDQARVTRREVRPVRLEMRSGRHYLIARCELRKAERCFRLDRIVALDEG